MFIATRQLTALTMALQLSWGSPVAAVCARGDLASADAAPSGCFDTKVTSCDMALRMQVDAVAGPTTEVSTLYCPTEKTADCAWFTSPGFQLQTDYHMPIGLRLRVATRICTCCSAPRHHFPVPMLGCQCCGQTQERMAHCRHSGAQGGHGKPSMRTNAASKNCSCARP